MRARQEAALVPVATTTVMSPQRPPIDRHQRITAGWFIRKSLVTAQSGEHKGNHKPNTDNVSANSNPRPVCMQFASLQKRCHQPRPVGSVGVHQGAVPA